MRFPFALITAAILLAAGAAARAQLSGADRNEIHDMVYAPCYLRIHVPTNNAVEPFLEISPAGYSWNRLVGEAEEKARRHNKPSGVYFAFKPNTVVKWGSLSYDKKNASITVWFQGKRDELKVIFAPIDTLDDFKKAFYLVFARMPLEEEHPDWPAEVRSAIAQGRVIQGMTRQQASCVVGVPLKTETANEGGTAVEIWHPLQDTNDRRTPKTGLPATLKFTAGKLTTIEM